jgi:signal transduction histidine kinase/DNA-binding response OmpR family regulator
LQLEFLNQISNSIAIAVHSATSRTVMAALLEQTQLQAREMEQQTQLLQRQQSELQQANEELQSQSEELQTQQEELRQANEELQSRTIELERQRLAVQDKNKVLESARIAIESKAKELELASRYKSEFLANMSHELRTPLNSLLILAQLLVRNAEGNLTEKQLEYAKTIHSAGADLLTLINEILDLSKVEAGRIEINREPCPIQELLASVEQKFHHLAEEKNLQFKINREPNVPDVIHTDGQRLKQIINNLLSNAFKFTEQGQVTLTLARPSTAFLKEKQYSLSNDYLMISVNDTGIGVPKDKQAIIFEAFQQADGTTSRRYGGTGLGLAISRQLARLLGGDLFLTSEVNVGSTFTLLFSLNLNNNGKKSTFLPEQSILNQTLNDLNQISNSNSPNTQPNKDKETAPVYSAAPKETVASSDKLYDDRDILHHNDKTLLIMEDDRTFANMLVELAHEKGFKCIRAEDGNTGLELVQRYRPDAIILDVGLPRIDGLTVLERLKDNSDTRHIPVHFISGSDQARNAKRMGAMGYLLKPVNMGELTQAFEKLSEVIEQVIKHLLLIVDNTQHQEAMFKVIADKDVECTICHTVSESIAQLKQPQIQFDAIVLDIDVENAQGLALLSQLVKEEEWAKIPVILYANRTLTETEEQTLKRFEDSLTVKSVASPERLLDEATLFMHQIANTLSEEKQQMLRMVHDKEAILAHKKVLLVDDDMRNTFALMTVLEDKDMEVSIANNGIEALAMLKQKKNIDLILMDIMMPEMDGYETMQAIRKQAEFRKLPIIALTAKAMKDDKVKCIEAGANDYLTKPVDIDKLLSLMRVWLYK